jgi:mono/diheme cytochrome c family protein
MTHRSRRNTPQRSARQAALAALVALGAAAPGWAEDDGAAASQGRADYLTYCASCHGADGQGDGPVAGSLKNRPPNLTYLQQQETDGEFPYQLVMNIIQGNPDYAMNYRTHGPADMPVWGRVLTEDSGDRESVAKARIRNLVEYIKSIQK